MIRLVSPKYLGGRTPVMVRQKVLQLLHTWTKEYPRELKIKEAYEMLKKQGVVEVSYVSRFTIRSTYTLSRRAMHFPDKN